MSVYVDPLLSTVPTKNWRYTKSCHLVADSLEELHIFASIIGMKRIWFQNDSRVPHYDLTENKRKIAVNKGAIELNGREFYVKFLKK